MPNFADDYINKILWNLMILSLKAVHCSEIFISTQKTTGDYKTEEISMNDQYRTQYKGKKLNILCPVNMRGVDGFETKKGTFSLPFLFYIYHRPIYKIKY